MSNKLSFRPRALDASKPMPIFMAEELPDLPNYSAFNRAVPHMPSVMHKEEECEHHLQRAICTGLIIPTPEVTDLTDADMYNKIYPADYKLPRELIYVEPFAMEQDIPDYDMDSEDEKWVGAQQSRKIDLTPLQFEEMMDRLEKSSGQTVVTLNEAKALLKEDDDLIIAVFDYWLNKRLKTQHPLLLTVKTEQRLGTAANNPYLAFRRRKEKMQTRKIRKNDEISYEKMLKLRRDLSRAVTLLELVKRREKTKREHLHLTIEIYEKRYQAQDFSGQILSEVSALKTSRPAFAPLFTNQFGVHQNWTNKVCKDEVVQRKEKRPYKKRKHKSDSRSLALEEGGLRGMGSGGSRGSRVLIGSGLDPLASSDDEGPLPSHSHAQSSLPTDRDDDDAADEGQFAFRRNRHGTYLAPVSGGFGNWPWCDTSEGGLADKKYRFALTSIRKPTQRCVGLARRRIGRGGRVLLDRCSDTDDPWSLLDYKIQHGVTTPATEIKDWLHFRPKTPPASERSPSDGSSDSESESEKACSLSREDTLSRAFPPDTVSISVDVESSNRLNDEPPFTSEFNIADYFTIEAPLELDLGNTGDRATVPSTDDSRTEEQGCSRFVVSDNVGGMFAHQTRSQYSDHSDLSGDNKVSTSDSTSSSASTLLLTPSSTLSSTSCVNVTPTSVTNTLPQQQIKHRQFSNNASILSKSLTSPTNSKSGQVMAAAAAALRLNFGNGHQNGPVLHLHNSNNFPNNTHNSQSTILLPQKHPPSNSLPGLITQTKYASLAAKQQTQQNQTQQIPTSGEITLNSNSEGLEMEVDTVESSSCDSKSQQQQLVRRSKTNSLAMEVT